MISDGLVGILRCRDTSRPPRSHQVPHYWLSDSHGNFIIGLDFSSSHIPRDGLGLWLDQRVHVRGEKIDGKSRPALLRVAFIQKEENPDHLHGLPSLSVEQEVCKHPSKMSPFMR
jgi:hypothetical protein